eukprot:jgi/Psemu1/12284/gm1.12284_g
MDKATPMKRGRRPSEVLQTKAEVMNMLNCMRKVLPIESDQWERVDQLHAENYPHSKRDEIQTNVPDDIALAKEIKYLIGQKADLGNGEEEFDFLEQGYTVDEDTGCNNNNYYTPIWECNNNNNAIPPLGQPSQLTSSSSVKSHTLAGESVIADAPFSLSSAKSKKAKKKRSYKRKVTSDDVLAAFHLSFEQQERNAETMSSIVSLARAYSSSRNNNSSNSSSGGNSSNTKCTHDESNNPMVK